MGTWVLNCEQGGRLGMTVTRIKVDMLADILRGSALSHHIFGAACEDVMKNADPGHGAGLSGLGRVLAPAYMRRGGGPVWG